MATITVEIDDSKAALLRKKAEKFGILAVEFVTASIEDLIGQPEPAFEDAMLKVISKNKELYKRLA
jgi:predicted RNA methylase